MPAVVVRSSAAAPCWRPSAACAQRVPPEAQPRPAHMQAAALLPAERDWQLGLLQQGLGAAGAAWQLHSCRVVDSTNSELLRRVRAGLLHPALLVAEHQTAGRGRLGRSWRTAGVAEGAHLPALTFSLAVPVQRADWSGLSLVVGLAVLRAIQRLAGQGARGLGLKWPNDLWWDGAKLAGILIESAATAQAGAAAAADTGMAGRFAVIGIGVNLELPPPDLASPGAALPSLPPVVTAVAATCLHAHQVFASAQQVLHAVLPCLMHDLARFDANGFAPFQAEFAAFDLLAGQDLWLSDGRTGRGLGVDGGGALRVCVNGAETVVSSGEVSVRPLNSPAPVAEVPPKTAVQPCVVSGRVG